MFFEGLVIQRVPYKERDLIVKLVLRSGYLGSFYVYGGQGGGKSSKPSLYQLGSLMKVLTKELRIKTNEQGELMAVAESQKIWEPEFIRHDIKAFYLSCLYAELAQRSTLPYHREQSSEEHAGLFSALSNALFYLDSSLKKKEFEPAPHLMLYLTKLLFHLGIMPEVDSCSFCGAGLMEAQDVHFMPEEGHFSCSDCHHGARDKGFLLRLKKSYQTKFQDYKELPGATLMESDKLIQFFCHHFHLKTVELKSYSLLFQ